VAVEAASVVCELLSGDDEQATLIAAQLKSHGDR
jgi:hypothetical protein